MILYRVTDPNHVEMRDVSSSDDMLAAMQDGWEPVDSIRRAAQLIRDAEQQTKRALQARDAMRAECNEALEKVEEMRNQLGRSVGGKSFTLTNALDVRDPWAYDALCKQQAEEIQKRGDVIQDLRKKLHEAGDLRKQAWVAGVSVDQSVAEIRRLAKALDGAQQTIEQERSKAKNLLDEVTRLQGIVTSRGAELNETAHHIAKMTEDKRRLQARVTRLESSVETQAIIIEEKQAEINRLDHEVTIARAAKVQAERALYLASEVGKRWVGDQEWYAQINREGERHGNNPSS